MDKLNNIKYWNDRKIKILKLLTKEYDSKLISTKQKDKLVEDMKCIISSLGPNNSKNKQKELKLEELFHRKKCEYCDKEKVPFDSFITKYKFCDECAEHRRLSLAIRRHVPPNMDVKKCDKCNNPLKDGMYCITCQPHGSINEKCYNCKICVAERKYIEETDKNFVLKYYQYDEEIYECLTCHRGIAFQILHKSSMRDTIHALGRKIHTKFICDAFASGRLS